MSLSLTELLKLTVSWALGGVWKSPCSVHAAFVDLVTLRFILEKSRKATKQQGHLICKNGFSSGMDILWFQFYTCKVQICLGSCLVAWLHVLASALSIVSAALKGGVVGRILSLLCASWCHLRKRYCSTWDYIPEKRSYLFIGTNNENEYQLKLAI